MYEVDYVQVFFGNNEYLKIKKQMILNSAGELFMMTEIFDAQKIPYEIKKVESLGIRQVISRLTGRSIVLERKKITVEEAFEFSYNPSKN